MQENYTAIKQYNTNKTKPSNINASKLEVECNQTKMPFEGKSVLEIETETGVENYQQVEIDKAGTICVFYICLLPFVKC